MLSDLYNKAAELASQGKSFAIATVVIHAVFLFFGKQSPP